MLQLVFACIVAEGEVAVIYFTQNSQDQAIKIGYSSDPIRRRAGLQSACSSKLILLGTIPGGLEHEGELHRRFAHHRLHGEWFNGTILPEVRRIIAQAAANPEPVTTNVIVAGDSDRDFMWSTDSQQMIEKQLLEATVYHALDEIHAKTPIAWVITAESNRQIETFANRWAMRNRIEVQFYRQNWRKNGKGAAAKAGKQMLHARFDTKLLLVFVGSKVSPTTQSLIRQAEKDGIGVVVKPKLAESKQRN